jgi:uncharacterized protein
MSYPHAAPAGRAPAASVRRLTLVAACALLAAGCGGGWVIFEDLAPSGLTRTEDSLRRLLATQPEAAIGAVRRKGSASPGDQLLRVLYEGAAYYYAADYAAAGRAFDRAYHITEDRFTRSVSRGAASLLTNDRALPYIPPRTERLMVHYYAALGHLRAGDETAAAVEARRLAALLAMEQSREQSRERARTLAFFRYFTGVVFEMAGEWNDADVAYRNALVLAAEEPGDDEAADSLRAALDSLQARRLAPPPDSGDVFLLLEQGYVAHRVQSSVTMVLLPDEVHALSAGSAAETVAAAAVVSARVLTGLAIAPATGAAGGHVHVPPTPFAYAPCPAASDTARASRSGDRRCRPEASPGADYLLHIAWPQYVRAAAAPTAEALVGGDAVVALHAADVSASVIDDYDEQKALVLARAIARAATKFAASRKAKDKATEERGKATGEAVGMLVNVATAVTEQADTRSWHLVPDRVSLARIRLPAGAQEVEVRFGAHQVVRLAVAVPAGGYTVATARGWR